MSSENPNWIFLEHDGLNVTGLILIPKCFIYDEMIIPRKPLGENAHFRNNNFKEKGWKLEILSYIDSLPDNIFTYKQMKEFFPKLKETHPNNNYIDKKVSQILQQLRDIGYIKFIDNNGLYMKIF